MTPAEFKAARHTLGLSVDELSFVINTNDRTIRRWEDGTRSPNPVAARVMEWMLAGFEPPQWPDSRKTDKPLDPRYFSVRSFNCMKAGGITTEGQLRNLYRRHGINGLMRLPNAGKKVATEISTYVLEGGEPFNAGPDEWKGE